MAAFWDVLWTDAKGAMLLVAPMMLLSLPASGVGALLGARSRDTVSWRQLRRTAARGVIIGAAAALILSMILQYLVAAEGLPLAFGRVFGDQGWLQLISASAAIAFLAAYLMTRRSSSAAIGPPRPRAVISLDCRASA
jgi:hypothetical protein